MATAKIKNILAAYLFSAAYLIETLWRFMKYEWIEGEAYTSWKNLVEYVENVLINFGTKYTINFA
ncbi:MAG: hypothetical protein RLZZ499_285 [Cyanobacteriota bacterium]|jgi:hypothetical protein